MVRKLPILTMPGKDAWALDGETVGENLDLYVGSEDGIVAMGNGINNKFSNVPF